MEILEEFLPTVISVLIFGAVWFIIRRLLKSLSDRINNAELYREDMIAILEEIRDELKELNKNNSLK
jgi:large-conductance mechanosensitive channel